MSLTALSAISNVDQMVYDNYMQLYKDPMKFEDVDWTFQPADTQVNAIGSNTVNITYNASEALVDWPNAFLSVPYVIAGTQIGAATSTGTSTLGNPAFVGFKCAGSLGIIDSVYLSVNGVTISQNSVGSAQFQYLKFITNVSEGWFRVNGPRLFMGSELPEAEVLAMQTNLWTASTDISTYGNITVTPAITDNSTIPADIPGFAGGGPLQCNRSFLSRCFNISNRGCRNMSTASSSADMSDSVNSRTPFILPSASTSASTDVSPGIYGSGYAVIPLPFVHDFFRAVGMVPYLQFNLRLKMNSCHSVDVSAGGLSMASNNGVVPNGTCPIMISTACATVNASTGTSISNQGNCGAVGVIFGSFGTSNTIGLTNTNGTTQAVNTNGVINCELWFPVVKLAEAQANDYASNPKTEILYSDFLPGSNSSSAENAGASFTHNVSSSTSPKRIWALLYTPDAETLNDVPVNQQCISSEGFLSTPGLSLRQLQVKVNGVPLYSLTQDYSYHQFAEAISEMQGVNAGRSVWAGQGIYSKQAWDRCRIYCFDLSRVVVSGTSPTVTVSGVNSSPVKALIRYFIEIENKLQVVQTPQKFVVVGNQQI